VATRNGRSNEQTLDASQNAVRSLRYFCRFKHPIAQASKCRLNWPHKGYTFIPWKASLAYLKTNEPGSVVTTNHPWLFFAGAFLIITL
jgi:hypothetical protein